MFKTNRLKNVSKVIKSVTRSDVSNNSKSIFNLGELQRFGLNGRSTTFAFDPIQSLLAIATDTGEIHVYGNQNVEVVFTLTSKFIRIMRFIKGIYLLVVDSKDTVIILSLYSKKVLSSFYAPNKITKIDTDPSLDWVLLGLQDGRVIIYDIDRDSLSGIEIENLQKKYFFPKLILSPIVSIQWNPRDIGVVLISYEFVTVVFSLVENQIKRHFLYELPQLGSDDICNSDIKIPRYPKVIQSLYHPNSLHILTIHENGDLVFWDANTGELIQARTLLNIDINKTRKLSNFSSKESQIISKALWMCGENPEYTSLLIETESIKDGKTCHNLVNLDLGLTPMYSVTSYNKMSTYYSNAKIKTILTISNGNIIADILPLAQNSPYFSGNYYPNIILVLLSDGEIKTVSYPSGNLTCDTLLLPRSLLWVRSAVTAFTAVSIPTKLWLGISSSSLNNEWLLKGGSSTKVCSKTQNSTSVFVIGYADGIVKIFNGLVGELEKDSFFDLNIASYLQMSDGVEISHISFASETIELAVSIDAGVVVLFKFQTNKYYNSKRNSDNIEGSFNKLALNTKILVDISNRVSTSLKEGFIPTTAIYANRGKISSLNNSNIGFVGISYADGTLLVVDRRGPATIYMENIRKFSQVGSSFVTTIHFSIMEYKEDGYSSILMLCGTDSGEVLIFKVLPSQDGRFNVQLTDSIKLESSGLVTKLNSFTRKTMEFNHAKMENLYELSKGIPIPSFIAITNYSDIKLITPGNLKEIQKQFRYPIATSGLFYNCSDSNIKSRINTAMIIVLITGDVKVLNLPELKEIASFTCPIKPQTAYVKQSSILSNGNIALRVSKTETCLLSIKEEVNSILQEPCANKEKSKTDILYNPNLKIPHRPQVNSLQWVRGTVYIKNEDLNILLGGEERIPSKHKESSLANGTMLMNTDKQTSGENNVITDEYGKQVFGKRLNKNSYGPMKYIARTVENGLDSLENTFNDYATTVSETMNDAIQQTSRDLVKGTFSSKMGF